MANFDEDIRRITNEVLQDGTVDQIIREKVTDGIKGAISDSLQKKEDRKVSRAKNPKYESMSLEELKANMEKSRKQLEHAIHNKNLLEQRKKLVERKERSHRLIVKGAEFEKAFPLSKDLEQEDVQKVMSQLKISGYNRDVVRNISNAVEKIGRQQIAEAVEKIERGDDS